MHLKNERIALIIPALNEEEALYYLLREIPLELVESVIVVDNNSTDQTAAVARAAGALVVSAERRGYGFACWTGFRKASELGAEIVVFMDGDGSDNPVDLPLLLAPLHERRAEIVMGSREGGHTERGAVPLQARFGNLLISRLLNLMYGTRLHDVGSFRAVRREVLEALEMREMTFGWPVEMLVKAGRTRRYRIEEVALHYRKRSHGHSKVAGTFGGSIKAAYAMLRTFAQYAVGRSEHA